MILFGNVEHGHTIAKEAGTHFNPACDVVISRVEDDQLYGGVIFTAFTGASIGIHMAGFTKHWVNLDMLWVAFDYPFNQLKVKTIFGQLPSCNLKALEVDLRLGFKEVTRIPDVFPDGDLVVVAMRKEDCRWLKLRPRGLIGKEHA